MLKDQSYWLHKLATLQIDRARGDPAPHKPFLLLVVLEMADRGETTGPELALSPDLAFRFSLFNSVIADRRNNDPRNGRTRGNYRRGRPRGHGRQNAHRSTPKRPREGGWQFDRGLWSVTDDYLVIVNRDEFIEEGVPGQKLADFDGHRLFLPSDPKYWPELTHLAWHREHRLAK
jgi:predicted restriction endonuclease